MLYLPCNYMEQGGNKAPLIYSLQMLYLHCTYMEQGGNKAPL